MTGREAHDPDVAVDSRKTRHRLTAWVMLLVFGLPVLLSLLNLLDVLGG